MKMLKRMTALFAAVLMMGTMLSTVSAYAKSSNFSVSGKTVTGTLNGTYIAPLAHTESSTKMLLYVSVYGKMVDKNGKNPKSYSNNDERTAKKTKVIALKAALNGNRYIVFTSTHMGQYNGATNGKTITLNL